MRHQPITIWRSRAGAALIAAVAAFLAAQIFIGAHAAKYGDGPHDHNGKACVVSLVSHSGDKVITASAFALTMIVAVWRAGAQFAQTETAAVAIRAARPRGPPNF